MFFSVSPARRLPVLLLACAVLFAACLNGTDTENTDTPPTEPNPPPVPAELKFTAINEPQSERFTNPVWFEAHPTEHESFLVAEQGGKVFLMSPEDEGDGYSLSLFAEIPASKQGYDGLLTVALHPDFTENRKYYVCYNPRLGELVLEERRADASLQMDAGVSRTLLRVQNHDYGHNGGDMLFGPDGYLYLALGDGSTIAEFAHDSQDLRAFQGKLLRLDVDHKDEGLEYAIPPDNPFVDHSDPQVRREIWAYGFRSPWRMSWTPGGKLILTDVGHGNQDEVNLIEKGGNYGWRRMEGNLCFDETAPLLPLEACDTTGLIPPVAVVEHAQPFSTCLIGGVVFRGDAASPLYGTYIFGDERTFKFRSLQQASGEWDLQVIGEAHDHISSLGTDSKGNIYALQYWQGRIFKLEHPHLEGKLTP